MTEIITIAGIVNFFKDDMNCIEKGELKYKSDFVLSLQIRDHDINSAVRASMKDRSYNVQLEINSKGGIIAASCECPRGKWLCSHMAATAIYVNKKGYSKTDLPNTWIAKPKKAARTVPKKCDEFFPHSKPEYRATTREVTDEDRDFFLKSLCETGEFCPMQWYLGPEPPQENQNIPLVPMLIEDLIQDFMESKAQFLEKCRVSAEQIHWLASNTSDQRSSLLWGKFRRLRLTGSNFGDVLKAVNRNRGHGRPFPSSLFKKLMGEYTFNTKDSIIWGQMHEQVALEHYKELTGNHVEDTGIHLFPCGFLGSSPDGIITYRGTDRKGVLEIKCPWKYRNCTISEALLKELPEGSKATSFYLTKEAKLRQGHNYWHQMQAEMEAVGVLSGDFVVWTEKETKIIPVEKDPNWEKTNIPLLQDFYLSELLPRFCSTQDD